MAAGQEQAEEIEKENIPPSKKRRLSLKKKPSLKTVGRFAIASRDEVSQASGGVVPVNTKRNNEWVARNFQEWVKHRNIKFPEDLVPDDILSCTNPETVGKWLSLFILETRKENGQSYPPKTLYGLLCGILRIQRNNNVPFNFLDRNDVRFRELHMTMDSVCSSLHSAGLGASVKSAGVISYEDEDHLWKKGVLSLETPRALLNTVFFYVGLNFCLRGGQEQRDLRVSQFRRVPCSLDVYNDTTYYEYCEYVSKNNQHRYKDIHAKNKVVKAFAVVGSKKCVVKILDVYFGKLPDNPKAFYLRPLESVPADITKPWFANVAVGINTLRNVISCMCEKSGLTQNYSNHSLRATAASRMFEKNVPEKIIAEKTGHRSLSGLRVYERTTVEQECSISKSIADQSTSFMGSRDEFKSSQSSAGPPQPGEGDVKPLTVPTGASVFSGQLTNCVFNFYNV